MRLGATAPRGRRPAAALALAVVALAGCGEGGDDRKAVDAYVSEANAVQRRAAPVLRSVDATYRTYSKGDLTGRKAEIALLGAESDLAGVEREVRALRPPRPARRLHELVTRTYAANVALARESRLQAAYVPRADRTLRALDGLRVRLRRALGGSTDPQRQAAALRAYARRLGQVRARLERLEPSPVLAPTHDAQLRRLGRARGLALELVGAIGAADAERVARLLRAFRATGGANPRGEALGRGALRAYAQRAAFVGRLSGAVARERARLDRDLRAE